MPSNLWACAIWNVGELRFGNDGASGRYIAIHAVRQPTPLSKGTLGGRITEKSADGTPLKKRLP
jgi:hypothetical protein